MPRRNDETLEELLGHLSPDELVDSTSTLEEQARVAQLQLIAFKALALQSDTELSTWTTAYSQSLGETDYS